MVRHAYALGECLSPQAGALASRRRTDRIDRYHCRQNMARCSRADIHRRRCLEPLTGGRLDDTVDWEDHHDCDGRHVLGVGGTRPTTWCGARHVQDNNDGTNSMPNWSAQTHTTSEELRNILTSRLSRSRRPSGSSKTPVDIAATGTAQTCRDAHEVHDSGLPAPPADPWARALRAPVRSRPRREFWGRVP
jgi:hypothetical protein